jgi:peptidoglycan/LPS O-acetylase OafA/YrhL
VAVIVVVILLATAVRVLRAIYFDYSTVDEWDEHLRKQVVTRMDSLMFGVLGAYLSIHHAKSWVARAKPALLAGLSLFVIDKAACLWSDTYIVHFPLTVEPLATLLLLPYLSAWRTQHGALAKAVTFISVISYSLYLVHLGLMQGVVLPLLWRGLTSSVCWTCGTDPLAQYVIYWISSIFVAYLLYRFFEVPTTKLRETVRSPFIAGPIARTVDKYLRVHKHSAR